MAVSFAMRIERVMAGGSPIGWLFPAFRTVAQCCQQNRAGGIAPAQVGGREGWHSFDHVDQDE
jgi:hypothetical protein